MNRGAYIIVYGFFDIFQLLFQLIKIVIIKFICCAVSCVIAFAADYDCYNRVTAVGCGGDYAGVIIVNRSGFHSVGIA